MDFGPPTPRKVCEIIYYIYIIYHNYHREVRLGGWGLGAEGPDIRQTRKCVRYYTYVACATILRLRALLYLRASH